MTDGESDISSLVSSEEENVARIAFGSCNKQNLPQDYWSVISAYNASHFLWMGDAVYTKDYKASSLDIAYDQLLESSDYKKFASKTIIDGVWDDHDYGVNDGSRTAVDRVHRQEQYESFLRRSGNSVVADKLSRQEGLYHDSDFELNGLKVKAIFLDTRYFRDDTVIPSLGVYKHIPLSALFSSALRGLYSVMGFFREYNGQMLGEAQWQWLESTLQSSTADMHLLISGVQIVTSNPIFESWTHFPKEQRRLLDLLSKYDPAGLVLLSGDIHMSELSAVHYRRASGERNAWIEMTTSGLTHSCETSSVQRLLCPIVLTMFPNHRLSSTGSSFTGKNFGLLEVFPLDQDNQMRKAVLTVMSIDTSDPRMGISMDLPLNTKDDPIVSVEYPQFATLALPIQVAVYLLLLSVLALASGLISRKFSVKSKKE